MNIEAGRASVVKARSIAITGGAGSVGKAAIRQLLAHGVGRLRVIDNSERALFDLETEFGAFPSLEFCCSDITDTVEMRRCFEGIDGVFHMAALKHVPICERSPFNAVSVNIHGAETVIRAATECGVKRVLFTSSDKAVNPTNVMGTSKLMGERLFTAANSMAGGQADRPIFASTRFGNVAGTNGSVIPLFAKQIAAGGPVTLTDPRMSRFVMTQGRAAELVIDSMGLAHGGEVFITKMPALRIMDLAREMIRLLAPVYGHSPARIEIRTVGSRPGEKLWEELSTDEEAVRIYEGDDYLVVLPAMERFREGEAYQRYPTLGLRGTPVTYHSERVEKMSSGQIADFLLQPDVLPDEVRARVMERGPVTAEQQCA